MTVTDSLIKISSWLNEGVCTKFKFKMPPPEESPIDDRYEYKEVHPHAFPLFVPAKDKLPPEVETNMPSVIVQVVNGEDDMEYVIFRWMAGLTAFLGAGGW